MVSLALAGQRARGVRLATGRVRDVDASGCQLEGLHVTDGVFVGCNVANVDACRARLTRVSFEACRMTGVRMTEAALQDVVVRECRVDLASFASSRLTRVSFEDCVLAQSDFLDCQLEAVRFHRCSLTEADFRGARMRRCEFRRNDLSGLQGIASLKGAALEWSDVIGLAGVLAGALGIEVLDEDRDR